MKKFQRLEALTSYIMGGNCRITIEDDLRHDSHVHVDIRRRFKRFVGDDGDKYRQYDKYLTISLVSGRHRNDIGRIAVMDRKDFEIECGAHPLLKSLKEVISRLGMEGDVNNIESLKYVSFSHDGKCGKCRKRLTTPTSIESGFGAVCNETRHSMIEEDRIVRCSKRRLSKFIETL